jgi:DNA-binding XRE family transcriptional regulator
MVLKGGVSITEVCDRTVASKIAATATTTGNFMAVFGHPASGRQVLNSFCVQNDSAEILSFKVTQRLREIRIAKGMSQSSLSQQAGLSRTGLRHIEAGTVHPTLPNVIRIANALEISLHDLFLSREGQKSRKAEQ